MRGRTNTIGITLTGTLDDDTMMRSPDTDHDYVLDARDIDGEPFGAIMAALDSLDDEDTLLLINSFEPTPLYEVLSNRGFTHETTTVSEQEWHVVITHR